MRSNDLLAKNRLRKLTRSYIFGCYCFFGFSFQHKLLTHRIFIAHTWHDDISSTSRCGFHIHCNEKCWSKRNIKNEWFWYRHPKFARPTAFHREIRVVCLIFCAQTGCRYGFGCFCDFCWPLFITFVFVCWMNGRLLRKLFLVNILEIGWFAIDLSTSMNLPNLACWRVTRFQSGLKNI